MNSFFINSYVQRPDPATLAGLAALTLDARGSFRDTRMTGSAAFGFDAFGILRKQAYLQGDALIQVGGLAELQRAVGLVGAAPVTFGQAGALRMAAKCAATDGLTFGQTGTLKAKGKLVALDGMTFGQSAALVTPSPMEFAVAYWKLEEASGTRSDATGRGNNLAETNGAYVSRVTGKVNYGVEQSSIGRLTSSSTADLQPSNSFSVAGWFTKTMSSGSFSMLVKGTTMDGSVPAADEWGIYCDAFGDTVTFWTSDGTTVDSVTIDLDGAGAGLAWVFFAATCDGGELKISINAGTPETAACNSPLAASNAFYLFPPTTGFVSQCDEVGIFNRVLSQNMIEALYNDGDGMTYDL